LILASLLKEELSTYADGLIASWTEVGVQMLAPPLFGLEVPSGLRQATHRKRIEVTEADELLGYFLQFPIRILRSDGLLEKAWTIGRDLNAPRLYDMLYIALAETEDCDLWTADRKLVNLASKRFPRVHFVGEVKR
jgi:predicted nucleic acid-binding protein